MYVLTELGYILICQVKEDEKKKCSFETAHVEKSDSSTKIKMDSKRIVIIFNLNVHLHGFVSLYYKNIIPSF